MNAIKMALVALAACSMQGCFFIWIPGSVVSAVGDALTGSEGAHCVSSSAKVGDTITASNGQRWVVKSVSGTSSRCTALEHPVRALLIPYEDWIKDLTSQPVGSAANLRPPLAQQQPVTPTPAPSNLTMQLPDGWEKKTLTDTMIANRTSIYAINKTIDAGLLLGAVDRNGITNLSDFALSKKGNQASKLIEPLASDLVELAVNGHKAIRFDVTGSLKSGTKLKYMMTIIEGEREIAILNIWATPANFDQRRSALEKLSEEVSDL